MARVWEIPIHAEAFALPASSPGSPDALPTNGRGVLALDPSSDEAGIVEFVVPDAYDGGTLKAIVKACANTTTAADGARLALTTEFITADAAEDLDTDDFDPTADEGTITHSTTAYSEQDVEITLTPAATPAKGDTCRIHVMRDVSHGDDDLAVDLLIRSITIFEEA